MTAEEQAVKFETLAEALGGTLIPQLERLVGDLTQLEQWDVARSMADQLKQLKEAHNRMLGKITELRQAGLQ